MAHCRRADRVGIAAIVAALALAPITAAATEISGVRARAGTLYDFDNVDPLSIAVTLEPDDWPEILRRDGDLHYEVGLLRIPDVDRGSDLYGIHFSPAWHFEPELLSPYVFFELGVGVTWLSGTRIRARDLGTRGHFVSHVLLGLQPGTDSRWHAGLRIRHTSNADFSSQNPGFDLIQFELGYRFGGD